MNDLHYVRKFIILLPVHNILLFKRKDSYSSCINFHFIFYLIKTFILIVVLIFSSTEHNGGQCENIGFLETKIFIIMTLLGFFSQNVVEGRM